jgi:anti-sigma B factor antagonist
LTATEPITTALANRDGVAVLSVAGEIDLATAPALDAAITEALSRDPSALVIELSGVEFMASAGLQLLIATQEKLSETTRLAVVANGPATSRPIQLTGLDDILSLYQTLDDALTAVGVDATN